MPAVVRHVGDLKKVIVDGEEMYRENQLMFQGHYTPVINTDNHFIYKTKKLGSAIKCTCGGDAVAVGYHVYKKWHSKYLGNEVLVCYLFMKDGVHGDGSH